MTKLVYTAGPLFQCSVSEGVGWRHEVKQLLGEQHVLDPTSWEHHPDETQLSDSQVRQLVERDLCEIDKCDALLWNLWKPSVGSAQEAWYAKQQGKLVVVVKVGPVQAWARYVADRVTDSLSDGCIWLARQLELRDVPCLKGGER